MSAAINKVRVDKWLWAARFFKTRGLAVEAIHKGRVLVNQAVTKPAREVLIGDSVEVRIGQDVRTLRVTGLSERRGPAPEASLLYREDDASVARRQQAAEQRRLAIEPAISLGSMRPSKRDRRARERLKQQPWNERWSASLD